ncbi:MAG: TlpA family protein disulfide reductase [Steroidobacteraceae bacterium]
MSRTRAVLRGTLAAGLILAAGAGGFALRAAHGPAGGALRQTHPPRAPIEAQRAGPSRRTAPPDTLPDIVFQGRQGTPRRLSDWRGHPLLVNFWAPWCSPCRAEIPLLEQLARSRPHGLQVIGVAVDGRAAVLRYAQHAGIRYPLLIGLRPGMRAIRALGIAAVFPLSVFVDAQGRIVTSRLGRLHAAQTRVILERIAALDAGRIDLKTARRQIEAGLAQLAVPTAAKPPIST